MNISITANWLPFHSGVLLICIGAFTLNAILFAVGAFALYISIKQVKSKNKIIYSVDDEKE